MLRSIGLLLLLAGVAYGTASAQTVQVVPRGTEAAAMLGGLAGSAGRSAMEARGQAQTFYRRLGDAEVALARCGQCAERPHLEAEVQKLRLADAATESTLRRMETISPGGAGIARRLMQNNPDYRRQQAIAEDRRRSEEEEERRVLLIANYCYASTKDALAEGQCMSTISPDTLRSQDASFERACEIEFRVYDPSPRPNDRVSQCIESRRATTLSGAMVRDIKELCDFENPDHFRQYRIPMPDRSMAEVCAKGRRGRLPATPATAETLPFGCPLRVTLTCHYAVYRPSGPPRRFTVEGYARENVIGLSADDEYCMGTQPPPDTPAGCEPITGSTDDGVMLRWGLARVGAGSLQRNWGADIRSYPTARAPSRSSAREATSQ